MPSKVPVPLPVVDAKPGERAWIPIKLRFATGRSLTSVRSTEVESVFDETSMTGTETAETLTSWVIAPTFRIMFTGVATPACTTMLS